MGVEYVVRGAKMRCTKSSNDRKINLPVSHGSYVDNKPILNEKDSTEENISYFGVCDDGDCLPDPEEITVIDRDGALKIGKKCKLQISGDWINSKDDTLVEGKPALTKDSVILCSNGGVITFISHGQD